ncbi:MAG TPA: GNAT family N-acetyltransferase [Oscillospiraceae bacterium]|nr:GNAT family N-acetyltransferase [Oscillospiraceae bacterium]HPF56174.1 GNAT family N-acetyltransferase [Clostridiales bacterium]HPK36047.1 GNAT family N-acetyltransferase [Oscillospiraceae bacterium]HPR75978.1 GNAT family N-acetyltransferase [Oscillospiraceae bacterium]
MQYGFRKCTQSDYDFLYSLKEKCFRWYVEIIYGWEDEYQKRALQKEMNKLIDDMNIIQVGGKDIGLFTCYTDENGDCCIGLFAILPEYQNQGIGSAILKDKLAENRINNVRTYLKTYKENPARFLYHRLGFTIYGETETHYLLEVK